MNEVWNLDRVYAGFDDPKFHADFAAFKDKTAEYAAFTKALDSAEPLEGLRKGIRLQEELEVIGDKLCNMAGAGVAFRSWACRLPNLMELVKGDDFLKELLEE